MEGRWCVNSYRFPGRSDNFYNFFVYVPFIPAPLSFKCVCFVFYSRFLLLFQFCSHFSIVHTHTKEQLLMKIDKRDGETIRKHTQCDHIWKIYCLYCCHCLSVSLRACSGSLNKKKDLYTKFYSESNLLQMSNRSVVERIFVVFIFFSSIFTRWWRWRYLSVCHVMYQAHHLNYYWCVLFSLSSLAFLNLYFGPCCSSWFLRVLTVGAIISVTNGTNKAINKHCAFWIYV